MAAQESDHVVDKGHAASRGRDVLADQINWKMQTSSVKYGELLRLLFGSPGEVSATSSKLRP